MGLVDHQMVKGIIMLGLVELVVTAELLVMLVVTEVMA